MAIILLFLLGTSFPVYYHYLVDETMDTPGLGWDSTGEVPFSG